MPGAEAAGGYGPLEEIARNKVNVKKVITHWPDMLRVAGSLVTNQVRAYDLLRMFGSEDRPNPLGAAFIEYGRIAKTLHLLAVVDPMDDTYRRQMHKQLTVQESRHKLAPRHLPRQEGHHPPGVVRAEKCVRAGQQASSGTESSSGMIAAVLVRFAYLAVSHAFGALWLLRMTEREKDVEILALRHQLAVLHRQLGGQRPRLRPEDRALLAVLLVPLARTTLRRLRLLVSPDTVLRWHRDLIRRRHARMSVNRRPGRPRTVASIRRLVLRLAAENPSWGYRRIHGELALLGLAIAASTVWEILKTAGIDPAPRQTSVTWADFLRSQAEAILAMDFVETVTLTGQRQYILAAIHHASRRAWVVGTTAHPTHAWVSQAVRNLLMDIEDTGYAAQIRFLIRDRDAKFPALIEDVLSSAGISTVLTGVRMPRMNSIIERWVKTLRAELLDRTLIWNQAHLRHALREYERHYNEHRTHRSLDAAAPLRARLQPLEPDRIERLAVLRRDRLGGVIHEYRHAA